VDNVTNEEVLQQVQENRSVSNTAHHRKLKWLRTPITCINVLKHNRKKYLSMLCKAK